MATTLGSLILELGLDDGKFQNQLKTAKADALKAGQGVERNLKGLDINEQLHLAPRVDHTELYELNAHLDKKLEHVLKLNQDFSFNPLRVRVDDRELNTLGDRIDTLGKQPQQLRVIDDTQQKIKEEITIGLSSDIGKLSTEVANMSDQMAGMNRATEVLANSMRQIANAPLPAPDKREKLKDTPQIAYDRRSGNYRWTQGQDRGKFVSKDDLTKLREEKGLWTPMARSDRQIQYSDRNANKFNAILEATFAKGAVEDMANTVGDAVGTSAEAGVREGMKQSKSGGLGGVLNAMTFGLSGNIGTIMTGAYEEMGAGFSREIGSGLIKSFEETFDFNLNEFGNKKGKRVFPIVKEVYKRSEPIRQAVGDSAKVVGDRVRLASFRVGDGVVAALENQDETKSKVSVFVDNVDMKGFDEAIKETKEELIEISKTLNESLRVAPGELKILDEFLTKHREAGVAARAVPRVQARVAELLDPNFKEDDAWNRSRRGNATKAVKPNTEEIVIVTGGFADKEGKSGRRFLSKPSEDTYLPGYIDNKDNTAVVSVDNSNQDTTGVDSSIKMAKQYISGFSEDAVEMVSQAIAARSINPEIKVKFIGESGGGFLAEEAYTLAQLMGIESEYIAVGTPNVSGALGDGGKGKVMSKDDRLARQMTDNVPSFLRKKPGRNQGIRGAEGHQLQEYLKQNTAELQQFLNPQVLSEQESLEALATAKKTLELIRASVNQSVNEVTSAQVEIDKIIAANPDLEIAAMNYAIAKDSVKHINPETATEEEYTDYMSVIEEPREEYEDLEFEYLSEENEIKAEAIAKQIQVIKDVMQRLQEIRQLALASTGNTADELNKIADEIDLAYVQAKGLDEHTQHVATNLFEIESFIEEVSKTGLTSDAIRNIPEMKKKIKFTIDEAKRLQKEPQTAEGKDLTGTRIDYLEDVKQRTKQALAQIKDPSFGVMRPAQAELGGNNDDLTNTPTPRPPFGGDSPTSFLQLPPVSPTGGDPLLDPEKIEDQLREALQDVFNQIAIKDLNVENVHIQNAADLEVNIKAQAPDMELVRDAIAVDTPKASQFQVPDDTAIQQSPAGLDEVRKMVERLEGGIRAAKESLNVDPSMSTNIAERMNADFLQIENQVKELLDLIPPGDRTSTQEGNIVSGLLGRMAKVEKTLEQLTDSLKATTVPPPTAEKALEGVRVAFRDQGRLVRDETVNRPQRIAQAQGIVESAPKARQTIDNLLAQFGDNVPESVRKEAAQARRVIRTNENQATAVLGELNVDTEGVGQNTVQGVALGIDSALNIAEQAGASIGGSVDDGIKDALDINSPSGVGIMRGEQVGEGMLIGLKNKMVEIHSAMREMMDPAAIITRQYKESVAKNAKTLPGLQANDDYVHEDYRNIPQDAKKVIFVSAGFTGTKGEQSEKIADRIKTLAPDDSHLVPFKNKTFDTSAPIGEISLPTWVKDALVTTGSVIRSGGNQDAMQLAKQVYDLKQKNPDADVKLMGHSAGGLIIREAQEILKGMGIFVEALSIGTPLLGTFAAVKPDAISLMGEKDELRPISGQKEGIVPGVQGHASNHYMDSEQVQGMMMSFMRTGITPELIDRANNLSAAGAPAIDVPAIDLSDAGANASSSLASGMTGEEVEEASRQLAQNAIQSTEDELGIASPSKVFMRIGKNIVDGFRQGIGSGLEDVTEDKIKSVQALLTESTRNGLTFGEAFSGDGGQEFLDLILTSLEQGQLPEKGALRGSLATIAAGTAKDFVKNPLKETQKGFARQAFATDLINMSTGRQDTPLGLTGQAVSTAISVESVRDLIQEGTVGLAGIAGSAAGAPLGPGATLAGDALGALLVRKITNDIIAVYEAVMDGVDVNNIPDLVKASIDKKNSPEAVAKAGTNYKQDMLGWAVGNTGANFTPLPLDGAAVAMYTVPDAVETGTKIGEGEAGPDAIAPLAQNLSTKWIKFTTGRIRQIKLLTDAEADFIEKSNEQLSELSQGYKAKIGGLVGRRYATASNPESTDTLAMGSEVAKNVTNLFDIESLKANAEEANGIFASIAAGMAEGFQDTGVAEEQARSLAQSIIQAAKDELGIRSPSERFKEIMLMCIAGLEKGAEEFNSSKLGTNIIQGLVDLKNNALDTIKDQSVEIAAYAKEKMGEAGSELESLLKESQIALEEFALNTSADTAMSSGDTLAALSAQLQSIRQEGFNPEGEMGNWEGNIAESLDSIIGKLNEASGAALMYGETMNSLNTSGAATDFENLADATNEAGEASSRKTKGLAFLKNGFQDLKGSVIDIAKGFVGLFAISKIIPMLTELGKSSIAVAKRFESTKIALSFLAGGTEQASKKIRMAIDLGNDLGVSAQANVEGYVQLLSATKGTALEGVATDQINYSIEQASAAYALDKDSTARINLAVAQMASKGKVSMEELRQQLGEVLPGAFQVAARAMGVTTAELDRLVSTGNLTAEEFLPRFAQQLTAETADGVVGASNSAAASVNRLQNAIYELQVNVGTALLPAYNTSLKLMSEALQVVIKLLPFLAAAALTAATVMIQAFIGFGKVLEYITKKFGILKLQIKDTFAQGAVAGVKNLGSSLLGLVKSVSILALQFAAFQAAIMLGQMAIEAFKDSSGEIGNISRKSADGLDAMKQRLDEIAQTADNAKDRVDNLKNNPEDSLDNLKIKGTTGTILQNDFTERLIDRTKSGKADMGEAFLGGALLFLQERTKRKQQTDTRKAGDTLAEGTQTVIEVSNQYLEGDKKELLAKYNEYEKQLKEVQRRQMAVRAIAPDDAEALKTLAEAEEKVLENRENALKEITISREQIDKELAYRKSALADLEEQYTPEDGSKGTINTATYNRESASLIKDIAALEAQQKKFTDAIETGARKFLEMRRAAQDMQATLSDATYFADRSAQGQRTSALRNIGFNQTGLLEGTQTAIEIQAAEDSLKAMREGLQVLASQMNSAEMQKVMDALKSQIPDIESMGPAQLQLTRQRLQDSGASDEMLQGLDLLIDTTTIKDQIADTNEKIAQSVRNAEQKLFELGRQLEEMFIEIKNQTDEIGLRFKEASNDRAITGASGVIGRSMSRLRGDFFSGFMDALQSFIGALQDEMKNTADFLRQQMELSQQLFGQLRQQEMFNQGIPQVDGSVVGGGQAGSSLGGSKGAGTLLGIVGNTGSSTGSHLDIRYSRQYAQSSGRMTAEGHRARPSEEHLARIAANGTPLSEMRNRITSEHGWRNHPTRGGRRHHDGIDYGLSTGTKLTSTVAIESVSQPVWDSGGGGWMTTVRFSDGVELMLLHQDPSARSAGVGTGGAAAPQARPTASAPQQSSAASRPTPSGLTVKGQQINDGQFQNARVIARVGREVGATEEEIAVAIATAIQESTLRNIAGGDRDSGGLFQQRPSQDWGTRAQITNPETAARSFFQGTRASIGVGNNVGLLQTRGQGDLYQRSHRVQRSAHPDAPRRWDAESQRLAQAAIAANSGSSATNPMSAKEGNQTTQQTPPVQRVDMTAINAQTSSLQQQSAQVSSSYQDIYNSNMQLLNQQRQNQRELANFSFEQAFNTAEKAAVSVARTSRDALRDRTREQQDEEFNALVDVTPERQNARDVQLAQRRADDIRTDLTDRQDDAVRDREVMRKLAEDLPNTLRSLGATDEQADRWQQLLLGQLQNFEGVIQAAEAGLANVDGNLAAELAKVRELDRRAAEDRMMAFADTITAETGNLMREQAALLRRDGKPVEAAELEKKADAADAIQGLNSQKLDIQRQTQSGQMSGEQAAELIAVIDEKLVAQLQILGLTLEDTIKELELYNRSASSNSSREVRGLQIQQLRFEGDPIQALIMEQQDALEATLLEFEERRLKINTDLQLDAATRAQLLADLEEIEAMTIEMVAKLDVRARVQLEIDNDSARLEAEGANLQALIPNLLADYSQGEARDMQARLDALNVELELRKRIQEISNPENGLTAANREYLTQLAEETAELQLQNIEREHALNVTRDRIELERNNITNPGGPQALAQVQDEYLGMYGLTPTWATKQERLPMQLEMQNLNYRQQLLDLEELRNSGKLTQEAFEKAGEALHAMNQIKLDQLRIEASGIPEIVNQVKGPMQGFFKEMLDPNSTKTFGEAFSDMINGMLANLANLAAEWVTNSLFSSFLGGGAGSPGKEGGLFGGLFGAKPEEDPMGGVVDLIGGGEGDPGMALTMGAQEAAMQLSFGGQEAQMSLTMGGQETANMFIMAGQQFSQMVSQAAISFQAMGSGSPLDGLNFSGASDFSFLGGGGSKAATTANRGFSVDTNNLNLSFDRGSRSIGDAIAQGSNKGAGIFGNLFSSLGSSLGGPLGSIMGSAGGAVGSGGGFGGILGSLFQVGLSFLGGFNSGGKVTSDRAISIPNFSKGGALQGTTDEAIQKAMQRERPYGKPRLAMLHEGEWVLNGKQQAIAKSYGVTPDVLNFAGGGIVGGVRPTVNTSNVGGSTSVSVPITINSEGGGDGKDDAEGLAKKLKGPIESLIYTTLQKEKRFGGQLS
jgi:tape measure domain-containing protein